MNETQHKLLDKLLYSIECIKEDLGDKLYGKAKKEQLDKIIRNIKELIDCYINCRFLFQGISLYNDHDRLEIIHHGLTLFFKDCKSEEYKNKVYFDLFKDLSQIIQKYEKEGIFNILLFKAMLKRIYYRMSELTFFQQKIIWEEKRNLFRQLRFDTKTINFLSKL